eukprot:TRINITY_DN431_c1_g1_i4.p1 TRINITY_DN431_c1_g1~~TRINITY_DN431_c1_g1_i4.p1  ORF type:complete len:326 (+),score=85.83 TRINITY_DN431_c1_g1_i4:518-1495(+)
MEHGAKKSVLMNPMEPVRVVLEKICISRGMNLQECIPCDMNGNVIPLNTKLGKIPQYEITFMNKGNLVQTINHPPFIDDVLAEMAASSALPYKGRTGSTAPWPSKKDKRRSQLRGSLSFPKSEDLPLRPSKGLFHVTDAYEFQEELGNGAFSVVRMAKHKETGEIVAIKILEKYEDDPHQSTKFKQEIEIMKRLDHTNIIKFYELDEDKESYYVVMEVVEGGELFDQIVAKKFYYEDEAASILAQVLCAVAYMHDVIGTVHRDLIPESLLLKDENYKVMRLYWWCGSMFQFFFEFFFQGFFFSLLLEFTFLGSFLFFCKMSFENR